MSALALDEEPVFEKALSDDMSIEPAYTLVKVKNSLGIMAKLHFTGTTSWNFNQKVDENINNWHSYQMLI